MALYQTYLKNTFPNKWENISFPNSSLDRSTLVDILKKQNVDGSEKVIQNIESLNENDTYTVVTGQQMGLMGGPLYTIYKTLNTVLICQELKRRFEDKKFVPILWMEGEDADFDEVSFLNYFKDNEIRKFQYEDTHLNSIGQRILDLGINDLSYILNIEQPFESERRWVEAFYLYFKPILDEFGIIAFHSNENYVYTKTIPFWNTVLDNHSKLSDLIFSHSQKLEQTGEQLQVSIQEGETFLFKHTENERKKIKSLEEIDINNDWLSPNVLLRPLYQDYIFPNVVYVAGNAEISYQMQIETAYQIFDRAAPVLFPRTHHIVINPKMDRLLQKYKFNRQFDKANFESWVNELLLSEVNHKIDHNFEKFRAHVKQFLTELKGINFADAYTEETILIGFEKRHGKILDQLQNKMNNVVKRRDTDKINHIHYLRSLLFPNNTIQERFYTVSQFDSNILTFSTQILEQMDIFNFDFQLFYLK